MTDPTGVLDNGLDEFEKRTAKVEGNSAACPYGVLRQLKSLRRSKMRVSFIVARALAPSLQETSQTRRHLRNEGCTASGFLSF